jgi:hypothetical protein
MTTYSPQWAPHIVGEFEPPTTDERGRPEPNKVRMRCGICKATHQTTCYSGAPRQWVLKFAVVHAHRDPLALEKEKKG